MDVESRSFDKNLSILEEETEDKIKNMDNMSESIKISSSELITELSTELSTDSSIELNIETNMEQKIPPLESIKIPSLESIRDSELSSESDDKNECIICKVSNDDFHLIRPCKCRGTTI